MQPLSFLVWTGQCYPRLPPSFLKIHVSVCVLLAGVKPLIVSSPNSSMALIVRSYALARSLSVMGNQFRAVAKLGPVAMVLQGSLCLASELEKGLNHSPVVLIADAADHQHSWTLQDALQVIGPVQLVMVE